MTVISKSLVPALIGAVLSGLGALLVSIYGDLLPALLPALREIETTTYIKAVVLLILLLGCAIALAFVLYQNTKAYKPRALSGKRFGYEWSAELDYSSKREEVGIEIQWLCPTHKVFLGAKHAEIPETAYYKLWCSKCDHLHDMSSGGAPVYLQEAEKIVRREILSELRLS